MGAVRRIILAFGVILISRCVAAQTGVIPVYACTLPGTQAKTSGMKSTNHQMGVIPSCTVTVYLTGTQTIATTTPQSPFTANTDGSIPPITAATGQGYDVTLSGGISPNTYPQPYTITDVFPGSAGCQTSGANALQKANGSAGCANSVATDNGTNFNVPEAFTANTTNSVWNICQASGMHCDGVTDDTTAFQNLLNAASAAGGGTLQGPSSKTMLLLGQITIPFTNSSPWTQNPIRITAAGSSMGAADTITPSTPGTPFTIDARFNGSRILSLGQGTLEIDHLNMINGGSNCGAFLQTTLTNIKLHDNSFLGAFTGTSACEDVWIAGGTNNPGTPFCGCVNDYFQGYGSEVHGNFADKVRRLVYGRSAFNAIPITNNVIWARSGSNITASITSATNANPVVLTNSAGHNFPIGKTLNLTFSGFTGNWTPLNGQHAVTIIDQYTMSVAVNSTSFGALTGTPVYLDGAAIDLDGDGSSGNTNSDYLAGNLIETPGYVFGIGLGFGDYHILTGNSCFDPGSQTLACVWQRTNTFSNQIQDDSPSAIVPVLSSGNTNNSSYISTATTTYDPRYGSGMPIRPVFVNGGSSAWLKLGTWVGSQSGDEIHIEINGAGGSSPGGNTQATTLITARVSAGSAPTLDGLTAWTFGKGGAITALVAQATNGSTSTTNLSWDIWVQIPAFFVGNYSYTISNGASWTEVLSTGSQPVTTIVTGSVFNPVTNNGSLVAGNAAGSTASQIQTSFSATGCATSAAVGAFCSTTVTWTTAFSDTNYVVTCSGHGVGSGVPLGGGVSTKTASAVGFTTVAATAAAAQYGDIECVAIHP